MIKVLIVDDEIHIIRLLRQYLESKRYDVFTATNGVEAIRKAKTIEPDVVLLDHIMPGMGGIEVLKAIKKFRPETVVIMLTAVIDESVARITLASGADVYITKPFNLENVETSILSKLGSDPA
ncbi:MAG TPA: response regulator [Deltaproteobacteria bacterium]|nr:response regulator [Deltaproteobacteria bacterium]